MIRFAGDDRKDGFTRAELRTARQMQMDGSSWTQIALAIGRKGRIGIRCRIDPEYRERRNVYHARYMAQARSA